MENFDQLEIPFTHMQKFTSRISNVKKAALMLDNKQRNLLERENLNKYFEKVKLQLVKRFRNALTCYSRKSFCTVKKLKVLLDCGAQIKNIF